MLTTITRSESLPMRTNIKSGKNKNICWRRVFNQGKISFRENQSTFYASALGTCWVGCGSGRGCPTILPHLVFKNHKCYVFACRKSSVEVFFFLVAVNTKNFVFNPPSLYWNLGSTIVAEYKFTLHLLNECNLKRSISNDIRETLNVQKRLMNKHIPKLFYCLIIMENFQQKSNVYQIAIDSVCFRGMARWP